MLNKFSFLITLFLIINILLSIRLKVKAKVKVKGDEDDEYGEEQEAIVETFNKINKLYKTKQVNYFTDYYKKVQLKDVVLNTANLMKADHTSTKSFRTLNAIANNVIDGAAKLKSNPLLKSTLKLMLNDKTMKIKYRVQAAKLAARLNNIPVTIQLTSKEPNKKPKNIDTHIIVPRIKRIYRPDYYVENYKAGNWDA